MEGRRSEEGSRTALLSSGVLLTVGSWLKAKGKEGGAKGKEGGGKGEDE